MAQAPPRTNTHTRIHDICMTLAHVPAPFDIVSDDSATSAIVRRYPLRATSGTLSSPEICETRT